MLNAISKAKVAASNEVPTFVSMWRRDRDLNPIFST
jgi:hypothetical protein